MSNILDLIRYCIIEMINIIKFKSKEIYPVRDKVYSSIHSLEELYSSYINIEPHAFLHAGMMSNTILKEKLNGVNAISIGIDLLKDSTLVKNNNLNIDVFDLDGKAVDLANGLSHEFKISESLKYFNQNVLSREFKLKKEYKLCILSQMDYILSDKEIESLLMKISSANIKYILILTPSIFSFRASPYKTVDLIYNFLYSMKSRLIDKHKEYITTFRRRESHLLNLFKKNYFCGYKFDYAYPSGREYLFLLQSKNLE